MRKNSEFSHSLIRHTYKIARNSKIPTFLFDSAKQTGNSFGERLANSVEDIFAKGFEQVIVIGNDCPDLTSRDLLQAKNGLQKNDWVLGPTTDGGVYLIGVKASSYTRNEFLQISWETSSVFQDFKDLLAEFGHSASFLVKKSDIDNARDLHVVLRTLEAKHPILIAFKSLFFVSIPQYDVCEKIKSSHIYIFSCPHRGPPFPEFV